MDVAASPVLRLFAVQPELLLDHLIAEPRSLIRLARTCQYAYKTCFSSAQLWREVCIRHQVFHPAASRFVTRDTNLSGANRLFILKYYVWPEFSSPAAAELRDLYKQDLLFAKGKYASQFTFASLSGGMEEVHRVELTLNWYVLIRHKIDGEVTILVAALRGNEEPIVLSFGTFANLQSFVMGGDKILILTREYSHPNNPTQINLLDVASAVERGKADAISCPLVTTLQHTVEPLSRLDHALDLTVLQASFMNDQEWWLGKFFTLDSASLVIREIASIPVMEDAKYETHLIFFVNGSGLNGTPIMFMVLIAEDLIIVNAKGEQLVKVHTPFFLSDPHPVLGRDGNAHYSDGAAGELQEVFMCKLNLEGKLDCTSIGRKAFGVPLHDLNTCEARQFRCCISLASDSYKFLSASADEITLHDAVPSPALCYRVAVPGTWLSFSREHIRGRIVHVTTLTEIRCFDWMAGKFTGKLEGLQGGRGRLELSPDRDVLCRFADETTFYRFW